MKRNSNLFFSAALTLVSAVGPACDKFSSAASAPVDAAKQDDSLLPEVSPRREHGVVIKADRTNL